MIPSKPGARQEFRAFTIRYNGQTPRITTQLKLTSAFDPAHPPNPLPRVLDTVALWDTGATHSVVTQKTAVDLGLVPIGTAMMNHAGGSSESNRYLVNVILPNGVAFSGVMVSECPDIAGAFGAIIGMDIITQGDLSITNVNHQTAMTFRVPSIQVVDYVIEANRITYGGVGRNDPCPCGKKDGDGHPIKFKHCHAKELIGKI